jgi:lipid A disaccharide synthetase
MKEEERLSWGETEDALRKADIAAIKAGTLTLRAAQIRARARVILA